MAAALAATPVPGEAASDEPARRAVSVIDRADIEMSGARTISDFLHHRFDDRYFNSFGIGRLDVLGGSAILVDGRRAWGADVGVRPINAIERIEILGDDASALHGEDALGGAVNIVLRRDYEGAEVSAVASRPGERGGEAEHASVLWGGALGRGHVTVGVNGAREKEVRDKDREFSKAVFPPSGLLADAQGINQGGNTVYFIDGTGEEPKLRTAALGDCPASAYAGLLSDDESGEACSFAYADRSWADDFGRSESESLFLTADHPLGDDTDFYVDAQAAFSETKDRYAPPVGEFDLDTTKQFDATTTFKEALAANIDGLDASDIPDSVTLFHRFVAHGNRNWLVDAEQYDVTAGVRGRFASGIGHDTWVRYYKNESVLTGGAFVSEPLIEEAVAAGRYDVANPQSPDLATYPEHWAAVRDTSVRVTWDHVSEIQTARTALDGPAFALPGGELHWTAGTEFSRQDYRSVYDHRTLDGTAVTTADALGSGGTSAEGERKRWSAFATLDIPLHDSWDLALAARHNDYDDVGDTLSRQIASQYRMTDSLALRASWSAGGNPPDLHTMHERDALRHPFVRDKRTQGDSAAPQQKEWVNVGNPDLKPSKTESVSVGATASLGPLSLDADWFQLAATDTPSAPSPQTVLDLEAAGSPLPPGARVVRDNEGQGAIDRIETKTLNLGEAEATGMTLRAGIGWETDWLDLSLDLHWLRVIRHETRVAGQLQPGDVPRDRVHASLGAARGDLAALWTVHSISAYSNEGNDGRYNRWVGHDLTLRWQDVLGVDGLDLTGGIVNIENRHPPADSASPNLKDESLESVLGRTVFVRTTVAW